MKKFSLSLALCLLIFSMYAQHSSRKLFTEAWEFKKGTDTSGEWRKLNLPHDWSIEGPFSKEHPAGTDGGALPGGLGWYRKTFTVPAANRSSRQYSQFDGVYCNSEVYLNGKLLGRRPNGYIGFVYDLTPYLNIGGSNEIVVKVDNSQQPNSRWYSGSGIYRNVWVTTLQDAHVKHDGVFVRSTVKGKMAEVKVQTELEGGTALRTKILDANKKVVATNTVNGSSLVDQSFQINNPVLWSIEKPYLYTAVSELLNDGKVVDRYETRFGIRSFYFDPVKGFFLNGKHVKIMGVCNHHDLGALGAAINTRALERQLEILKGMGINGIRTSHNPPAPELLELCDKMGFIVMDEAFDMWKKEKTKFDYSHDWDEWHKKDLEDFVRRDRNHPSVFIWSVGNEIPEQWGDVKKGDSSGMKISHELVSIVKSLDTTRPITTGNNEVREWNQLISSNAFDLVGYNYNHWKWEDFPKEHPGKSLIITESVSALETRGYYDLVNSDTIRRWPKRWDIPFERPDDKGNVVSAYDHVSAPWGSIHEESLKLLLKHDYISGMYNWTGFDYLGEPTPYKWPSRSSYFGIVDLAGFPKDVYYLYQSLFTNKDVLHIYPHWNWKAGDTVDIVGYYNHADKVELFLNGQSLGSKAKSGDDLHIKWRVPYEAGTIKAVAYKNGKPVREKVINTAGNAAQLSLSADRTILNPDGKDLSFVTVTIRDAKGNMVPTANNLVKFTVSGAGFLRAVDSGDPTSHESFQGNSHTALNGLVLAIIQSNGKQGKIRLTASAEGMKDTVIELSAR
jgi:beta-galactosidase